MRFVEAWEEAAGSLSCGRVNCNLLVPLSISPLTCS